MTRKIERDNEEFVVALSEDKRRAIVTSEKGVVVTISYDSGNFNVRLPNGWGSWKSSMDAAVEYAVRLCFESRTQLIGDQAYQEMLDYVEAKANSTV